MKSVVDSFASYCEKETGRPALVEPSPIELAEPCIRLAFGGLRKAGNGRSRIPLLLNLTASGDGPDTFLDEIAQASLAVSELMDGPFGFPIFEEYGVFGMAYPERLGDGGFEKNGDEGKKPYRYIEAWRVTVEFTQDDIPAI